MESKSSLTQEKKLRILVVSQDYQDYNGDDTKHITDNIKRLDRLYSRFGNQVTEKPVHYFNHWDKFEDLIIEIKKGAFDIIHFSMHGAENAVVFSPQEPNIPYSKLLNVIRNCDSIKAVLLMVCNSSELADSISKEDKWALGWAGMPDPDETTEATSGFYAGLFSGGTIEESFAAVIRNNGGAVIYPPVRQKGPIIDGPPQEEELLPGRKISLWWVLIAILVLFILGYFLYKAFQPGKPSNPDGNPVSGSSSLITIIQPESNSEVSNKEMVTVAFKGGDGTQPWIFIAPPGSEGFYPQSQGNANKDSTQYEFYVTIGASEDSGLFGIVAAVIPDKAVEQMMLWHLSSFGKTIGGEDLKGFLVASDTLVVRRIPVK